MSFGSKYNQQPGSNSVEITFAKELAPAYDLTYSLNPELNIKTRSRALSVNGKRTSIDIKDLETIADRFTIKNFKGIVMEIQASVDYWSQMTKENNIPVTISDAIYKNVTFFIP